ncbi:helix-turn-helix domain-containing protein [Lentilactobacillus senioris]|uniref:helix-turn-helix domain-containing protein n=1 Tax=Lentilactobacillus senioris TaxID=931534 RepID=UPI003D26B7DC
MMKVNLNDSDIMSAKEAAQVWGKNDSYVKVSIRQSPEKWPEGSYRLFGRTLVVTTEGMESATGEKDPRKK